jgi:hypothetical protein
MVSIRRLEQIYTHSQAGSRSRVACPVTSFDGWCAWHHMRCRYLICAAIGGWVTARFSLPVSRWINPDLHQGKAEGKARSVGYPNKNRHFSRNCRSF